MIRLTPIQTDDYAQIKAWAQKPAMAEYFRYYPLTFVWDTAEQMQNILSTSYLIKQEDRPIGITSLQNFDAQNRKVEWGLAVDPDQSPKNRQVLKGIHRELAAYVFDYLGYNKLSVKILNHHDNWVKDMQEAGYTLEGILRDNLYWNGQFHTEVMLGITATEYRSGKCQD